MGVQSINAAILNSNQLFPQTMNSSSNQINGYSSKSSEQFLPQSNTNSSIINFSVESRLISSTQSTMQFQNQDGDSVTLSTASLQYQKTSISANGIKSKEDWQKLVDYLKNQYSDMKNEIMKGFLKDKGISTGENTTAISTENSDIQGLPDYWNADNTSQRIVDFATSFFGMFQGSGGDFVSMMKDAIEKGFSMAKDITGDLPDAVTKLVGNTHDLALKKLDDCAKQQGINMDQQQNTQESQNNLS